MLGFYTGSSQLKIVVPVNVKLEYQAINMLRLNSQNLYGRNLTTFKQATSVHMNYFCAIAASTILMLIQCLDAYIMTLRSLSIYLVTLALSVHFLIPTSESQSLDL
nr:AlNc14C131G6969 [Albugo laibachii Nc14]|eukprot:CCA21721.1 AlNc14C131G6969 [Albugo laibachii Nc14]